MSPTHRDGETTVTLRDGRRVTLTATQLSICKQMELSPEEFAEDDGKSPPMSNAGQAT